jgi:hypothetical protein
MKTSIKELNVGDKMRSVRGIEIISKIKIL